MKAICQGKGGGAFTTGPQNEEKKDLGSGDGGRGVTFSADKGGGPARRWLPCYSEAARSYRV